MTSEIRPGDPRYPAFAAIRAVFALFCLYMLLPVSFYGPIDSLDPAFRIALQMAAEKGLVWGRDVHFSYGPLSFLATRLAFPGVKTPLLVFDIVLYGHLVLIVWQSVRRLHTPAEVWCMAFVFFVFAPEFQLIDLSIVLFALELYFLFRHQETGSWSAFASGALLSIYAFYVKSNSGLVAVLLVPASLAVRASRTSRIAPQAAALAAYCAALFGSSVVVGVDLPGYLEGTLHIVSGYNDAMFIEPDERHVAYLYGAVILLASYSLWALVAIRHGKALFEIGATGLALFVLFKQGFTRADEHILAFFKYAPLFVGALYLHVDWRRRGLSAVFLIALVGAIGQASNRTVFPLPGEKLSGFTSYLREAFGPPKDARDETASPRDVLPQDVLAEIGEGSVDILPQHSQVIYYNRLRYEPRPMHMTWNVFDSWFDRLNAEKISSPSGPDYVIVAPHNLEEGYGFDYETRTKLALLTSFDLDRVIGERLLVLSRTSETRHVSAKIERTGSARFGDRIAIPPSDDLVLVSIKTDYVPLAALRRLLYQPPGLDMSFVLADGTIARHRVRKPVIENGMIGNIYVREPKDYEAFYSRNFRAIPKVESLILHERSGWGFQAPFRYEISAVSIRP